MFLQHNEKITEKEINLKTRDGNMNRQAFKFNPEYQTVFEEIFKYFES